MVVRHYELMLGRVIKTMYYQYLTDEDTHINIRLRVQVNQVISYLLVLIQCII